VARIDPVSDYRRDQRDRSDAMGDGVAGETRERRNPVGNVGPPIVRSASKSYSQTSVEMTTTSEP
jgi:hypothetical protein